MSSAISTATKPTPRSFIASSLLATGYVAQLFAFQAQGGVHLETVRMREGNHGMNGRPSGALLKVQRRQPAIAAHQCARLSRPRAHAVERLLPPAQGIFEVGLLHTPRTVVAGAFLDRLDLVGHEAQQVTAANADILDPNVTRHVIPDD